MSSHRSRLFYCVSAGVILLAGFSACVGWWRTAALRDARAAYARGAWDAAITHAARHLRAHADSREAALLIARSDFAVGRWDEAERRYEQFADLNAKDREFYAATLAHRGRWAEAAELYATLAREKPDDPELMQQRAAVLMSLGQNDRAIELCERLAGFPAYRRSAYFLLANASYQQREFARAAECFEWILATDPELADPRVLRSTFWQDLGSAWLSSGRLDLAQKRLEQGLVLVPSAELLDLLAQVHAAQRHDELAERYWLQAVDERPDYVPALRALAQRALARSSADQAAAYLEQAARFAPWDLAVRSDLVTAYERAGREPDAESARAKVQQLRALEDLRQELTAVARTRPDGPETRVLAAIDHVEQSRYAEAETTLREVLRSHPGLGAAQRMLIILSGASAD